MGKALKYSLVARDRDTNEFEIIKINGKRLVSLEDIDLLTMDYNDSNELSESLSKTGDIDYYIATRQKRNGETDIITDEVIYSNNANLRDIAINSKNKRIKDSEDEITALLALFCRQMSFNGDYHKLVINGRTDIYDKLIKMFYFSRYHSAKELKRKEGSWLIKSYTLTRNIVESIVNEHATNQIICDKFYRNLNTNRVAEQIDSKFDENQMTMFDLYPEERQDNLEEEFSVMQTFNSLPIELVLDDEFVDTLPDEFQETVVTLVKNLHFNNNQPKNYSIAYTKKIETAQAKLLGILKQKDLLSKVIVWCNTYNENSEKVSGDEIGYSYRKGNNK